MTIKYEKALMSEVSYALAGDILMYATIYTRANIAQQWELSAGT